MTCDECGSGIAVSESPAGRHCSRCRQSLFPEDPKPQIVLGPLSGPDGNAWVILGRARDALRQAGRLKEWPAIEREMKAGDYQHLLDVTDHYFDVLGTRVAADPDWRTT